MDFTARKEGKFEYIEEGEGRVIVLLHGLFGALSNFGELIQHFSKNYKVVIPILPIYTSPLRKSGVGSLAEFVREFVEYKGFKPAVFVGNSLGGHISLVYTLRYMEDVEALILTGSSGLYENAMGNTFPKRGDYEYIQKKAEDTFYNPAMATKELVDELYNIVNQRDKVLRVLAVAKSAIRHNMKDQIPKITIPVHLIWGEDDTVTPPFVAKDFDRLLPNSRLDYIDKCGHAPMMERPKIFNELMGDFLSNQFVENR